MLVVINYEIMKKIFIEVLMQFTSCFFVPIAKKSWKAGGEKDHSMIEYQC